MAVVPDEEIHLGAGQRFRVLDLVQFDEEYESPFVGCWRSRRCRARRLTPSPTGMPRSRREAAIVAANQQARCSTRDDADHASEPSAAAVGGSLPCLGRSAAWRPRGRRARRVRTKALRPPSTKREAPFGSYAISVEPQPRRRDRLHGLPNPLASNRTSLFPETRTCRDSGSGTRPDQPKWRNR